MIRRARIKDLPEINELLTRNRLNPMTEAHLQDYCLVGEVDSKIRGVIWAGVTKSRLMAHIDYFAVDPNYIGLGFRLAKRGVKILNKLGIKKVLTFVENLEDREVSFKINNRFGLKCEKTMYYLFTGETKEMVKLWENQPLLHKSPS